MESPYGFLADEGLKVNSAIVDYFDFAAQIHSTPEVAIKSGTNVQGLVPGGSSH